FLHWRTGQVMVRAWLHNSSSVVSKFLQSPPLQFGCGTRAVSWSDPESFVSGGGMSVIPTTDRLSIVADLHNLYLIANDLDFTIHVASQNHQRAPSNISPLCASSVIEQDL